ncbi:UNVERIFIED_CONTAM: hypothetical protein RKD43_006006 [Streptomyces graminofaciens]
MSALSLPFHWGTPLFQSLFSTYWAYSAAWPFGGSWPLALVAVLGVCTCATTLFALHRSP